MLTLIAPAGDVLFILVNKKNEDKHCVREEGRWRSRKGWSGQSEVLRVWRPEVG